jgi:pyrimidine operon attenuation protein/uracil phosphoribosyltransferase
MKSIVFTQESARRTLTRMAYELYEKHYDSDILVLAGIKNNGFLLAELLAAELSQISPLKIQLVSVEIDKKNPQSQSAIWQIPVAELAQIPVVLIDDVANSGSTLFYAMQPWMHQKVKSLKTAVLVDRAHKRFPTTPDFIGLSLATTLQDHVEVVIQNKQVEAYLR